MQLSKTIDPVTDEEMQYWPKDVIVDMEPPWSDERGSIQPLVDMPMKSCVLITSKKGTVRADHWHATDWHYCYVFEGEIDYYHRPVGSDVEPEKVTIKKGQLFFTPPQVEHTMVFVEDTTFLTLGRNSRAQEVYEADVTRMPTLNPDTE